MKDSVRALAEYRMTRAAEAFEDAVGLADRHRWNAAVNRFYYSAYYAAKALLATREIDAASHAAAIALFQLHFVKSGAVPPDVARFLPRAFEMRQDADYVDFQDATAEHVDQLRRNVATFTEACRRVLDERLRAEDSPAE